MPDAYSVHTGYCYRGMSRPKDAQVYAFQPENHAIWVSKPALRGKAKGLELKLDLDVIHASSRMNAIGPVVFYIEPHCNVFDCNCEPVTTHSTTSRTHWLTLPFPNTVKKP